MPHEYKRKLLNKGDLIGVMAPSSKVAAEDLELSRAYLEDQGYRVFIHPQCQLSFNQSAGTPDQKRDALHDLVRRDDIAAIFFATGGNRALTFADLIDYALLSSHPKIYMGFSDNSALLNIITARTSLVTYHGPTFKRLPKNPQASLNLGVLCGNENKIPLPGLTWLRGQSMTGKMFGGNLSLVRAMKLSDFPNRENFILFLEDIKEELSRTDRDLLALRRSGLFDRLAGIIFGDFTDPQDTGVTPFGFTVTDMIREHTDGFDFSVAMNAPFGHGDNLPVFPIGAAVTIQQETLMIKD